MLLKVKKCPHGHGWSLVCACVPCPSMSERSGLRVGRGRWARACQRPRGLPHSGQRPRARSLDRRQPWARHAARRLPRRRARSRRGTRRREGDVVKLGPTELLGGRVLVGRLELASRGGHAAAVEQAGAAAVVAGQRSLEESADGVEHLLHRRHARLPAARRAPFLVAVGASGRLGRGGRGGRRVRLVRLGGKGVALEEGDDALCDDGAELGVPHGEGMDAVVAFSARFGEAHGVDLEPVEVVRRVQRKLRVERERIDGLALELLLRLLRGAARRVLVVARVERPLRRLEVAAEAAKGHAQEDLGVRAERRAQLGQKRRDCKADVGGGGRTSDDAVARAVLHQHHVDVRPAARRKLARRVRP
mmetsp:Transcript_56618/g.148626  ORF Transcript_56618/g.148626 Transcript_56618/m.148626 type:complete len:362 (+) Transcript_56618:84-1169(+)